MPNFPFFRDVGKNLVVPGGAKVIDANKKLVIPGNNPTRQKDYSFHGFIVMISFLKYLSVGLKISLGQFLVIPRLC